MQPPLTQVKIGGDVKRLLLIDTRPVYAKSNRRSRITNSSNFESNIKQIDRARSIGSQNKATAAAAIPIPTEAIAPATSKEAK